MNGRPVSCEAERKRKKKGVPRNREETAEREWSGAGRADRFEVGVAVGAGVGAGVGTGVVFGVGGVGASTATSPRPVSLPPLLFYGKIILVEK